MQLDQLCSAVDFAALVPPRYAVYRPAVADAFRFFLSRLSAERQAAIVAAQAALPPDATPAVRLVHLMHECPTLHKLGQVIARHRDLDAGLRAELQRLESMEPRTPREAIQPIIEEDLRTQLASGELRLDGDSLAEASVAVVVPVEWRAQPGLPPQRGVLKVLKPGVRDKLNEELAILSAAADEMDQCRAQYGLPDFGYRETFDEVRELLTHEVRFDLEQRHLDDLAERFNGGQVARVPRRLPLCSPRITAMERVDGVKVTDAPAENGSRRRLARALVRALVADVVFSRADASPFHADPHAGNLFADSEGRLILLDLSLVGILSLEQRELMARVVTAAATLDADRLIEALAGLALRLPDDGVVQQRVGDALREVRRGGVPGPDWLMRLLHGLAEDGARFPADLLLFRKALLTLSGVVADVCPDVSLDHALVAAAVRRFAEEWPRRPLAMLTSRDFDTHLSNWDLFEVFAQTPRTLSRFWAGAWKDWLARFDANEVSGDDASEPAAAAG